MKKLREISLLVGHLFIIEQLLFTVERLILILVEKGWDWLNIADVVTGAIGVSIGRAIFMIIPLIFIYVIVLENIHLQRLVNLALLNIIANAIVMLILSLTLLEGVMETLGAQLVLVFSFLSPFILSIVPVFNESVKAVTGIGSDIVG